jgi:hypothetical protein
MATLPKDLRNKLEKTTIIARNLAENAAVVALKSLAVHHHEPYAHMKPEQRSLRNKLRAHARQLVDSQDNKGQLSIDHLAQECGYEHWHRMLFARFLAENNLLIEPDSGMAISLDECKDLAKAEKMELWDLAGLYAQRMLPAIFRPDDPALQIQLAKEDQLKLEKMLDDLPPAVFTASDSLGWCYQFWQTERKDQVNTSGKKIGADELPAVTQLFTEDYMVDFLLDNTLGAWWAARLAAVPGSEFRVTNCLTEEEARRRYSLPGCEWKYLRFVKSEIIDKELGIAGWRPAAGTFDGWPKTVRELKCLDPCMGSGHFVVGMFDRLVAVRMAEEELDEPSAVYAVIRDNLFGLEIDPRCTQIAAFNLALAAWRRVGYCALPAMNLACSGLAPNAREEDWIKLAGDDPKLQDGMERLYQLFKQAPILGSLINPRAIGGGDLFIAEFHELQPLLEQALKRELADDTHEMAVIAQGIAKAAEILAGQFSLVATNVPYLGRGKQDEVLQDYCERMHPTAKADLATCFVERCLDFCTLNDSTSLVTPQNWLFLVTYKSMREYSLRNNSWKVIARLGPGGFEKITGEVVSIVLLVISRLHPTQSVQTLCIDVRECPSPGEKDNALKTCDFEMIPQADQIANPDSIITIERLTRQKLLENYASGLQGISSADNARFKRCFWEVIELADVWAFMQSSPSENLTFGGRENILWWGSNGSALAEANPGAALRGEVAHRRWGVAVARMSELHVTLYSGELFDDATAIVAPRDQSHVAAIWAFCSSGDFQKEVRRINQKLSVANATLVKVPFDIAHWQKVAAEMYPNGLPKPHSDNPTQWLFKGHPKNSDHPLHVAVARMMGYLWPRQTGSSFPDCPALGPDGLEKLADTDGIACIPSVRGEEPAADKLRKLLAETYGNDWKANSELELIRDAGSNVSDFDEWLRSDFFEQHCGLFHHRPFIWHIWDGRKRDGFHVLVNYHMLAAGDGKGRRVLENLTHSYLGEWISRQKDGVKRGEEGAEARIEAALELKKRLEAIIEGESPYDIFVRWKPLEKQANGWEPDINDGVRMNIRPFLSSDLPNGRQGAGILRSKPNIKWEKDRGREPIRKKEEFPWFWKGGEFTGDRVNDVHLTNVQKRKR